MDRLEKCNKLIDSLQKVLSNTSFEIGPRSPVNYGKTNYAIMIRKYEGLTAYRYGSTLGRSRSEWHCDCGRKFVGIFDNRIDV